MVVSLEGKQECGVASQEGYYFSVVVLQKCCDTES